MLSRVSSVISEFIKPVSSSNSQETVRERQKEGFKRFRAPPDSKESKDPKSGAQVIPFPKAPVAPEPPPNLPALTGTTPSVAHSFITLLSAFKQRRGELLRWFAHHSYRAATGQRKLGRYKKGAMLDQKVE